MLLVKDINQYDKSHVHFSNSIKNNIIKDSNFIKILYFTPSLKLNGIYLKVNIPNFFNGKNSYRNNYIFDTYSNSVLIEQIKNIEIDILSMVQIFNKIPEYDLYKKLIGGNIKIITDEIEDKYENFIIKISGIWETDTNYGLNYKFIRGT